MTVLPCSILIVYCKLSRYRQVKRNHHLSECLCLHHPSIPLVHFAQFYLPKKQSLMVIHQSLQNRESCHQELLLLKKRQHQKVLKLFQILLLRDIDEQCKSLCKKSDDSSSVLRVPRSKHKVEKVIVFIGGI